MTALFTLANFFSTRQRVGREGRVTPASLKIDLLDDNGFLLVDLFSAVRSCRVTHLCIPLSDRVRRLSLFAVNDFMVR